ncbi:MFS transporter [Paraburkholderia antibiotica]|uniref:MFS transporter n=1 Tax=Paraburkholderia antibiotica TaxID=2728839 RepID=A0A7Y0A2V3_9BURK|nr:MFS transporter [Paraburkholderia antibiotica]NML35414.1 MFS transporter [Paraburkholderia antibiotica]
MTSAGLSASASPIYRRVAWRLIPFLFICYVVNFVDRVNISFAKLQFLQSLHLTEADYGLAAGMLFLGYTAFVIPGMKLVGWIGARRTMATIMTIWGLCTIVLAFASSQREFYLVRFLIGASEAAFAPCVILYLTYWFPQRLRGQMMSLFEISPTLAGIIGGPLAGWILQRFGRTGTLEGWQWLFLLEGAPAVVLGVMAWWWLTDGPRQARWLSEQEARFIEDDIRRSVGNTAHRNASFRDVAMDPRVYGYAFVYFAIFWCLNIFGTWTPTLLREAGVATPLEIGVYSSLIAIVSALGAYLMSRSSDHRLERFWHITAGALLTVVAFLSLRYAGGNTPATVALLCIGSAGIFTALSLFWTTPTTYLSEHAARHGIAIMATLGSIGGFLSATLSGWLKVQTGSLSAGNELAACVLVAGIVVLRMVLRPPMRRETLANLPLEE